jgi:hypothetical protein
MWRISIGISVFNQRLIRGMKRFPLYIISALLFTNAYSATAAQEPYLITASRMNYKTSIGIVHDIAIDRGIVCRRWFSDQTAAQLTIGENSGKKLSVGLTGIRSLERYTFLRIFGFSSIIYEVGNPKYALIGFGSGIEYYIGNLEQTITYGIDMNPVTVYVGLSYAMGFRF